MSKYYHQTVTDVHHWNDSLFSIKTTRPDGLRFRSGEFAMLGIMVDGKPLARAYSIASPNWAEHLEFYSIKVPNGPLTSRLQHIQVGDEILVSKKPTGTLVLDDLLPAKHLYLLATGTGLAPFLAICQDIETFERFEKVILVHGVRHSDDLAYRDFFENLHNDPVFGEMVAGKFIYYPTTTRDDSDSVNHGRITDLLSSGKLFADIGLPPINPADDRVMICGSMGLNADVCKILDGFGLKISPRMGEPADYVVERAFVG